MDDITALLEDSGEQTMEQAMAKAEEIVNELDNVTLNIAVTGETGAGKSLFVNAIRGVKIGDEGYAKTGVRETTMEPTEYPHPTMPNVKIFDLPGIGSTNFKANAYMKKVAFKNYDFFIIVSASRFKENDVLLAKNIKKQKKSFYFVRSKVDMDVANQIASGEGTEEETLRCIRDDCLANLKSLETNSPVFLITSHDLSKYDFQKLIETLKADLGQEKMDALMLSLPVYSMQSLDEKYSAFKKSVWALAVVSGGIGAAPVPGLSFALDTAMVLSFLTGVYHSSGLDDEALERMSEQVEKKILEEVKKSELIQGIGKSMLTSSMLRKLAVAGGIEAVSCMTPIAGNIVAAGVSFVTTRAVLQQGLDELYQVAKKVLEMANLQ
ncbi:interferon-inducible GTPase 5-like [Engraulis encrasicolus]|uniref:interferon-inducible GTPase 5-like n=1 Tax=Engraulis encrasicolus TaxID=184585 RepID=UPI002FD26122